MPWRVGPAARQAGVRPDPYAVWLSEIMLQQTTVAAVKSYFLDFTRRWPTVGDLAAAEDDAVMAAWAGLGYYARARNLLKCARAVAARGGAFPRDEKALLALPGIGPYTAAAMRAIAFDQPATVLDGNVERVMARLHAVTEPLPGAKPLLHAHAAARTPAERPGDYAQAVMDLGATICTPRAPACGICPWMMDCAARRQGIAAELPRKQAKRAKPVRHGIVYLALRPDGALLLERRPERGLLGGMLGLPGTPWQERAAEGTPPVAASWCAAGEVRHTFTHFHLRLAVYAAAVAPTAQAEGDLFFRAVAPTDLPTVFRKAVIQGRSALSLPGAA
ncbi:MAG: A/G-specific adenine glycosylase [Pseudomonadota bacterium]